MSAQTVTVIDPDVLAVAKEIYGRRDEQKFGGNRRWRQLKEEFPELADAVRPPVPRNRTARPRSEWDDYRDEEERTHRHWESWARSQTAARKPYFYRGRVSVMQDAESTSPGWCVQYGSWHHTDRGRWSRARGAGPDETTWADDHVAHKVRGQDLRTLHAETDGNYTIEGDGSRDNQLEVCRACNKPLDLPRDDEGNVVRGPGEQQQYCLPPRRCKLDVYNARRRAERRVARLRSPKKFDIVYVAGFGKVPTVEWSALDEDARAGIENRRREEPYSSGPQLKRPYLHLNARSLSIPSEDIISVLRDDPATGWAVCGGPDSIARRSGQRPAYESRCLTAGALRPGWDRVERWWRYVPRASGGSVKQVDDKVWCISR
jgi:hypothetical protein